MDFGTVRQKLLPSVNARVHVPGLAVESRPWALRIVNGAAPGPAMPLAESMLIGREGQVDLKLPASSVSRRHCHLWRKRGGYWIADLGATNPTLVNGMLVRATPLFDNDLISVGDYIIKLLAPDNPENDGAPLDPVASARDTLTGVFHRQAFRAAADIAWAQSAPGTDIGLVLLDIDHFKHVIDRFGPAAGDRVLGQVARVLRDQGRPRDLHGRIGGEEFAILLPATSAADTQRAAERLRLSIAALQLLQDGEPILVTASLGCAHVLTGDGSGGLDALYARADGALYEAKRLGRNRVLVGG